MSPPLSPLFADVVFPDRLTRPFTYRIPVTLCGKLKIGQWIVAPLGAQTVAGFILSFSEHPPAVGDSSSRTFTIREIQDALTTSPDFELDSTLIELARWMSDYYLAPLGNCLDLIQPPRSTPRV